MTKMAKYGTIFYLGYTKQVCKTSSIEAHRKEVEDIEKIIKEIEEEKEDEENIE